MTLVVRYGTDIIQAAERSRVATTAALREALGSAEQTEVTVQHVHVSDVTIGDPQVVDPSEER